MDLRDIEKAAREQGWHTGRSRRGHPVFTPPDPSKRKVYGSGSPSDWRAIRNLLAQLKREGLIWPWPPPKGAE